MSEFKEKQWQGKKWYCYGTSMTDCIPCTGTIGYLPDKSPNSGRTGYYAQYLAEYAGLEEHNFGRAGKGIIPSLYEEDDIVKTRVMTLSDGKAEADLITVEVIPNDDVKGKLGEITDWSDDTFCGNLNQMLEYLLSNTKAYVAILIATRARYNPDDLSEEYTPASNHVQTRLIWEEAVQKICSMHGVPCWNGASEAGLGYYRVGKETTYMKDQIHLAEEGGKVLAKYYWGKLKNVYPVK